STFTAGVESDFTQSGGQQLANVANVYRATEAGQPAQTIYLRVRHSSAGTDGPWGPWSNTLEATFAAAGGTGGSSGDGNPYPYDDYYYPY
ncbi:MAG TPA: hypothetical protein VEF04_06390, partial [Blastocatellia bacterium]|nr:hypothetical protein [Blastocatellia bacterium]